MKFSWTVIRLNLQKSLISIPTFLWGSNPQYGIEFRLGESIDLGQ